MATLHTNTPTRFSARAGTYLAAVVANLFVGVVAWNENRKTRQALGNLTEVQLNDIGLTRSDINKIT